MPYYLQSYSTSVAPLQTKLIHSLPTLATLLLFFNSWVQKPSHLWPILHRWPWYYSPPYPFSLSQSITKETHHSQSAQTGHKITQTPGPWWLFNNLVEALNSLLQGHSFHTETPTASISMMPKPNTDDSNYRLISILNLDIKLFTLKSTALNISFPPSLQA